MPPAADPSAAGAEDTRPAVTVFDIDGVLADVSHRLHHLSATPQRWHAFFTEAKDDDLLPAGAERLEQALEEGAVVYLTGRPEWTRELTEHWLDRHGLPAAPLFMRANGDRRPARVTKAAVLRTLARQVRILTMVDDDPAVVRALRSSGWPVELATWLPHSSTLQKAQEDQGRT
jgi:phosphoglycolate phosphatase-like HAD superfamily hydrolase